MIVPCTWKRFSLYKGPLTYNSPRRLNACAADSSFFIAYQRQQLGTLLQTGSSAGRTPWSLGRIPIYAFKHLSITQATCNQKEAAYVDVACLITTRPVHALNAVIIRRAARKTHTTQAASHSPGANRSLKPHRQTYHMRSETERALGKCTAASRLCPPRGSLRLLLISAARCNSIHIN